MAIFATLNLVIVVGVLALSIYALILFLMLARKGIKALDLYIQEKENNIH